MRVLPWFMGAVAVVAIGGAVAGAAIDTTPRKIHESPNVPAGSSIDFDDTRGRALGANHYPLETRDRTVEVAELRERGLYSQDRYARTYYIEDDSAAFDFDAAEAEQRRWEASQLSERPRQAPPRPSTRQPLELERPAKVAEPEVEFVSRPVVQDTSGMAR